MKTRIFIIAILSIAAIELSAQTYGTTYTPAARDYSTIQNQQAIQSQQIMTTGNAYNGTVYEPFSSATPSEYSEVGSGSPKKHPGKPKTWIGGPESGQGPSPVGDAILPLLLMAVVYGVGCTVYKRRQKRMSE